MSQHPHILLVEDDEDDRYFAERILSKAGWHSIHHVNSGQAAIDYLTRSVVDAERAKAPSPEIIFLDLKIPGINGHQVLDWIKTQPQLSSCQVYILSSSGEERDRTRAAAATDYFVKPLTVQHLQTITERLSR